MTIPDHSAPHRRIRRGVIVAVWLLIAALTTTVTYALLVFGGR
ncbi:hypothetical protein [Microbacterium sp. P04]